MRVFISGQFKENTICMYVVIERATMLKNRKTVIKVLTENHGEHESDQKLCLKRKENLFEEINLLSVFLKKHTVLPYLKSIMVLAVLVAPSNKITTSKHIWV